MSPFLIKIVKLTRLLDDTLHIHLTIFSSGKNGEIKRKSRKNLNSLFFWKYNLSKKFELCARKSIKRLIL